MTGAAACLAGFEGISVVIHGSSGCYYYPTTLLHAQLHGTFIVENEVIFGSEARLREVVESLAGRGNRVAVITTCVPALLGEDIRSMLAEEDVLLVDSPGFSGDIETGYAQALSLLAPRIDPSTDAVNIDGVCLFDPFYRGNIQEITRLLTLASVPVGTIFCCDTLAKTQNAAPFTMGTNTDFQSGIGMSVGGTLGIDEVRRSFETLGNCCTRSDISPVERELREQEEEIIRVCDKYLRRFDPPGVMIFAGASYAGFAGTTLSRYLDADILYLGSRNQPLSSKFRSGRVTGLAEAGALIEEYKPDLVIGSSFEKSLLKDQAFTGITPPLRGYVRLAPHPLAGVNGTLCFIEQVLNACMSRPK